MMQSIKALIFVGALLAATVAQADLGKVKQIMREQVSIYDADGNFVEKRTAWKIPASGVSIQQVNGKGQLGIADGSGQIVYVRSSEVVADRPDPCVSTDNSTRSGMKVAAGEGVGSGMSGAAARCVR